MVVGELTPQESIDAIDMTPSSAVVVVVVVVFSARLSSVVVGELTRQESIDAVDDPDFSGMTEDEAATTIQKGDGLTHFRHDSLTIIYDLYSLSEWFSLHDLSPEEKVMLISELIFVVMFLAKALNTIKNITC